jgi:glucose/arabinose dehydrogenase
MPLGKIMRLRDDGSVPPDNPFAGRAGFLPEIYSYGHRNPLGLTVHPVTGEIWESEFGPRGGDEVNRIKAGGNYGWMLTSNGMNYDGTLFKNKPSGNVGLEDPVMFFIPSINPGNLVFYNDDKFPQWKGDLLMAVMTQSLFRATLDAQGKVVAQERMLGELKQRMRDVRVGPDGNVYLLTDETIGAVLKVEPGK